MNIVICTQCDLDFGINGMYCKNCGKLYPNYEPSVPQVYPDPYSPYPVSPSPSYTWPTWPTKTNDDIVKELVDIKKELAEIKQQLSELTVNKGNKYQDLIPTQSKKKLKKNEKGIL